MSTEKAQITGDANFILLYGNKIHGFRQDPDSMNADGSHDPNIIFEQVHWYVSDDGKWEPVDLESDVYKGLQSYMSDVEQKMALLWVPHQAITINENDEVVSIDLP
jgi:hypothetical protein